MDKEATQNDVVVVFAAGHGYNYRGDYYILPVDGDPEKLRSSAVRWDDFADILGNLPSRVLLFLDTCHSGGFAAGLLAKTRGAPDTTEAIRELTSEEYGVVVMAAATSNELSSERKEWGHGAFTKALIEGLEEGLADTSGDGIIHVRELDRYVATRVKQLTGGKQHSITVRPPSISSFPIFQLDSTRR